MSTKMRYIIFTLIFLASYIMLWHLKEQFVLKGSLHLFLLCGVVLGSHLYSAPIWDSIWKWFFPNLFQFKSSNLFPNQGTVSTSFSVLHKSVKMRYDIWKGSLHPSCPPSSVSIFCKPSTAPPLRKIQFIWNTLWHLHFTKTNKKLEPVNGFIKGPPD